MIGVATTVGALLIVAFDSYRPDLEEWFLEAPERLSEKLNWMLAALAVLSLPLLFGAAHLWRLGQSVMEAGRFPPPGVAVVRDTPVITGAKAVLRGRFFKFAALILAACAVAVPTVLWWLSQRLLGNA